MPHTELQLRISVYRAAQRKGVDFLLAHVNSDGSIGRGER